MNKKITLTVAEFTTGIQEIVLVDRHGRVSEDEENHRFDKNNLYRAVESQLSHRVIDCSATVEIPNLQVTIRVNRCYHQDGKICRVHYVHQIASEMRQEKGPKWHEIETLQLAAWVASKHFSTPPKGIRLVYHVLAQDNRESPVLETWVVDLPLDEPRTFEERLTRKLQKLEASLRGPDDALPHCSMDERHGTEAKPFQKCRDYCRARHVCPQFAGYKAKAAEIPGFQEDGKGASSFSFIGL
jgi:hypothetical protein